MAELSDVLTTTFKVVGAADLIANFRLITQAATTMAEAATAAGAKFGDVLTPILLGITGVIVVLAALKAEFDLVTASLKAFSEETRKLFATEVLLKNLGSTLTGPDLRRIANTQSRATGIARPEIEQGAGELARTGISGANVERGLKVAADAARAFNVPFEHASEVIKKGIEGSMRGLREFGITLQDTGSRAANFELIMQQINLRAQGGAEAFRTTLPGSIEAMSSALQRFLSDLGENFAPAAIRVFNLITKFLDFLSDHIGAVADALMNSLIPFGAVLGHALGVGAGIDDPMKKVGMGGDPATEKTLSQVADNTKIMADSVVQSVLGGQGQIVEQAFGFMSARMAMAI